MLHARRTILICGIASFVIVCPSMSSMAQTPTQKKQTPVQTQSPVQKIKDCLLIEDGYKERLECYDAVIKPEPRPSPKKATVVAECRFLKEEDQRLETRAGQETRAIAADLSCAAHRGPAPRRLRRLGINNERTAPSVDTITAAPRGAAYCSNCERSRR